MKLSLKKTSFNLSTGQRGEMLAWNYLVQNGYHIVEKNFRCPIGEIDVVAEKNGILRIVEIKTRTHSKQGRPEEAVHVLKQKKLVQLAKWYIKDKELEERTVSFDIVAVSLAKDKEKAIRLIENAISLEQLENER